MNRHEVEPWDTHLAQLEAERAGVAGFEQLSVGVLPSISCQEFGSVRIVTLLDARGGADLFR